MHGFCCSLSHDFRSFISFIRRADVCFDIEGKLGCEDREHKDPAGKIRIDRAALSTVESSLGEMKV